MLRTLILIFALFALPLHAGPENYRLDVARSSVNFNYILDGVEKSGSMPVTSADLLIDLDNVPTSRVLVTLNARAARAGFIFATEAMKSRSVLDTARFPEIHFRSTRIRGTLRDATVEGNLTVRGVTRPVTLDARLFRQRGTAVTDRSNLLIELTGGIDRASFGADGYKALVGDHIKLRIVARIMKDIR